MAQITKIDVINDAYSQLRISGLTVEPTPEDTSLALNALESMMAEYFSRNICVGYIFEDLPDPNSLTGVELRFKSMMSANLAMRIAADFGKQLPASLTALASAGLSTASQASAIKNIQHTNYPARMPRGSGNATRYDRFNRYYPPTIDVPPDCDTHRIIIGDINDYYEDFSAYLKDGEAISSFTITADAGLTLQASANEDPRITYRVEAVSNATQGNYQQVKIVITTDDGRVNTRLIDFDVQSSDTVGA
jgi:hypothetical protein